MNKNKAIDDVSENLKQTMQRINELENENESANENNDNPNSTNNFFKNSKLSFTKKSVPNFGANLADSQTKLTSFKAATQSFPVTGEGFNSRTGFNKTKQSSNNFNNTVSNNNDSNSSFRAYSNNILKNLDNLYNDLNKDFSDLENFIQSAIQH
jgi:hypothetical protein